MIVFWALALGASTTLVRAAEVTIYQSASQIPKDLTAIQYFQIAVNHATVGNCEVAREATKRAINKDPNGPVGIRAKRYLASNIPKYPVPEDAARQNGAGFDFIVKRKLDSAIAVLEDTIAEFPKFEWPYNNLACAYIEKRDARKAHAYAEKALKINPEYANAWAVMANAYILEGQYSSAKQCALKAIEYDPQNKTAAKMLQFVSRKIR